MYYLFVVDNLKISKMGYVFMKNLNTLSAKREQHGIEEMVDL